MENKKDSEKRMGPLVGSLSEASTCPVCGLKTRPVLSLGEKCGDCLFRESIKPVKDASEQDRIDKICISRRMKEIAVINEESKVRKTLPEDVLLRRFDYEYQEDHLETAKKFGLSPDFTFSDLLKVTVDDLQKR